MLISWPCSYHWGHFWYPWRTTGFPLPYLLFYHLVPGFHAMGCRHGLPCWRSWRQVCSRHRFPEELATFCEVAGVSNSYGHRGSKASWRSAGLACFSWSSASSHCPSQHANRAAGPRGVSLVSDKAAAWSNRRASPRGKLWEALKYMYFSTYHWLPLVNGSSRFYPPTYTQLRVEIAALPSGSRPNS